jgi:TRAP-type transport system small permease protein
MPPSRISSSEEAGAVRVFDRLAARLDRWSQGVSFALFRFGIYLTTPALVVLVTLDVTLRYVFNSPLQWARDVNGLLLLVTIFCTLPHAWDRAAHIRMEVFYARFSPEKRRRADVLSSLTGVLLFGAIAVQAARFVPFMMQTRETGEDLEFVLWPFMGVVAICAVVTAARIFANPTGTEEGLLHAWDDEPPATSATEPFDRPASDESMTEIDESSQLDSPTDPPRRGDIAPPDNQENV